MNPALLTGVFKIGEQLIKKWFPDPEEANKRFVEFNSMMANNQLRVTELQAAVIEAETRSESWLACNWRPLTMLTFVVLIAAHWLGFSAPNLSEDERLALIELVKIGLGGYVLGRSAEKGIKAWKNGNIQQPTN